MITAVDTSVSLDVFGPDPIFGLRSGKAIRVCLAEGSLIACEVVWAEIASFFPSADAAQDALGRFWIPAFAGMTNARHAAGNEPPVDSKLALIGDDLISYLLHRLIERLIERGPYSVHRLVVHRVPVGELRTTVVRPKYGTIGPTN